MIANQTQTLTQTLTLTLTWPGAPRGPPWNIRSDTLRCSAPLAQSTRRLSARRTSPLRTALTANAGIAVSAWNCRATEVFRRASRTAHGEGSGWSGWGVRRVREGEGVRGGGRRLRSAGRSQ